MAIMNFKISILAQRMAEQKGRVMRSIKRTIGAFILVSGSSISLAHEGATGIIKERMDRFKQNKEAIRVIKGNLAKDTIIIAQKVSEIEKWANEMVDFFPEGSNQAPSEALPAIWENFGDFTAKAVANATAAADLKTLAQSGADQSALIKGLKVLGKTCKDCHNDYRE